MPLRPALLALLLVLAVPAAADAAPAQPLAPLAGVWDVGTGELPARSASGARPELRLRDYVPVTLDRAALRARLDGAPAEGAAGGTVVELPLADGELERFRVQDSPVMAPALARRFPEIRSFSAQGLDDPTARARLDIGPLGFHAAVREDGGMTYIDPYYRGGLRTYAVYRRADLVAARSPLAEPAEAAARLRRDLPAAAAAAAPGEPVVQRTYRLALAADPSYTQYFGGTDLLVQTAKVALMNRVNQLYNDDLAIRMELVPDDFELNFFTEAEYAAAGYDPDEACSGALLDQNQAAIDAIIGDADYDIGHIVKEAGGGGIAQLGSVGQPGAKAQGCTGLSPPVGDGFAIDYVAHEMGHQFGGPHTFDAGAGGSCLGLQRDLSGESAVEPGSGSSIQAYAGICDTDNLQANSDPYFSQQSIDDILGYVTSGIDGATEEGTEVTVANQAPVADAGPDHTIPVRTPFTLTGTGTDPDGDGLVYLWEQNDSGRPLVGIPLQTDNRAEGPLFRVFSDDVAEDPTQSPAPGQNIAREVDRVRSIPDPAQVAAGNTNADTGTCALAADMLDCYSELLPTAAYAAGALHFRLTARDRDPTGGGVAADDAVLTLDPTAGPFDVTGPEGPAPLTGATSVEVTWDVAGTNTPALAEDVRISFSTDGGLTFGLPVLESTPNDGAQTVTVPNVATTTGRFKVEAVGNVFHDVSGADLTVSVDPAAPTPGPTATPTPAPTAAPTVDPLPVQTPTPSPTATYAAPGGGEPTTPTPTPTAPPGAGIPPGPAAVPPAASPAPATGAPRVRRRAARPSLARTARRLRVSRRGRVRLRVGCVGRGQGPFRARCTGVVRLRGGGRARFSVRRGATRAVRVRLRRRALRRVRRSGRQRAVVTVRTDAGRRTRKRVVLRA